jgi:two-component system, LytTR family, response regulator
MKISCIAVDDEPLALDQIGEFISRVPYLELKASFKKGFDALGYLKANQIDLVFLDIHLDDISGIQVLKNLRHRPFVILTTAYDQYALEGFDLDVNDYLLKPICFERFVRAVEKVRDLKVGEDPPRQLPEQPANPQEYIFVKSDYRMHKVVLQDIMFIEGYKDYVKFNLHQKKDVVSLLRFRRLENILPAEQFCRVHKSFIVAVGKIDSIGKNAITIAGHTIPIGETFKDRFFCFLKERGLLK